MILDGKKIEYQLLDVAADESLKKEMRDISGNPKALPPQICNDNEYCGVRERRCNYRVRKEDRGIKGEKVEGEGGTAKEREREREREKNGNRLLKSIVVCIHDIVCIDMPIRSVCKPLGYVCCYHCQEIKVIFHVAI